MYTTYYGMSCNPFLKNESINYPFESIDYTQCINRFHYLKEIKGIGLFIGESGYGKTYVVRQFINSLNKDLYKVIYISAQKDMSVFDFFKILSDNLGLDVGACYKTDIYMNIQKEIKRITLKDKMQIIIIIDDAHLLTREILLNFKLFYDFDMDSKDYISLMLVGQPDLKQEIAKNIHTALKQRIIVNYTFEGLERDEVKRYITTRLNFANVNYELFEPEAYNALYAASNSSPRTLNILVINSLMLSFQNNLKTINSDIVMNAKNEMDA